MSELVDRSRSDRRARGRDHAAASIGSHRVALVEAGAADEFERPGSGTVDERGGSPVTTRAIVAASGSPGMGPW